VHRVGGFPLELRASAGVATFPRDAEDLTGLLRAADVALARAQAAGGGAMAYVPDPA
jgi:GGDEF domain-containing protein